MGEDEEGTLATLTAHRTELIEPCITEHRGRVFKIIGDGLLVEFASVVDAVRCAVAFQDIMAKGNAETPRDSRIEFRIGVNLGDVIVQDDDVYGDGVNVAARLEGLAEPGGVVISASVHDQIKGKLDHPFDDLGPQRVKNIGEPIRALCLRKSTAQGAEATRGTPAAPPLPDKPSIVVLPFDNISNDPEQEYFSDGITEDIITELSKISGLFVIGRHSAFTYKGQPVTLKQVGRELGVGYVLEGSVRRANDRLRITAQLIDTSTDHHLWAERFDRNFEDIFAVQEEVARNVAEALAVALRPVEAVRLSHEPTNNLQAYDIFLRTRTSFWPPTRVNIMAARTAYTRVVEMDPNFAGGHVGASITHSIAAMFGHSEEPRSDAKSGMEYAQRAMTLDNELALSHSTPRLGVPAHGETRPKHRGGAKGGRTSAGRHRHLSVFELLPVGRRSGRGSPGCDPHGTSTRSAVCFGALFQCAWVRVFHMRTVRGVH